MTIEPQRPGGGADLQPQPFSEGPREAPGGCGRPLLVGCSLAVVLVGLLLLVLLFTARDWMPGLFRWSLEQFEAQVATNLPPDLGEAERQRLADAFDSAAAAVEDGSADPVALQGLQGQLLDVARSGRLSREQVRDLTEALEEVAADRAPPAEAEPAPGEDGGGFPVASRGPVPGGRESAADPRPAT